MKNDRNDMTMASALSDAALNREKGNELDMRALATTGYDKADQTLDKLHFLMCALAAMETSYSDQTVNGLVQIIDDVDRTLREYVGATRTALISAEAIVREKADGVPTRTVADVMEHGGHLPSQDLESAVILLIGVARATSNQMRFMASADECYGDTLVSLAANLEKAVADVESTLDRDVFNED